MERFCSIIFLSFVVAWENVVKYGAIKKLPADNDKLPNH